jgi:hypothetical protein
MDGLLDLSDKKLRRYALMVLYTLIALAIVYFMFRKRNAPLPAQPPPKPVKKDDNRPRVSISGALVTPETLKTLSAIGRFSRLHLILKVSGDDEEAKFKEMLAGLENLSSHRVLFCDTIEGYRALIRQLNPQLHVDVDLGFARDMGQFINAIALVTCQDAGQFYQLVRFTDCEREILRILKESH